MYSNVHSNKVLQMNFKNSPHFVVLFTYYIIFFCRSEYIFCMKDTVCAFFDLRVSHFYQGKLGIKEYKKAKKMLYTTSMNEVYDLSKSQLILAQIYARFILIPE